MGYMPGDTVRATGHKCKAYCACQLHPVRCWEEKGGASPQC